jgi:hypothetical protein
MRQDQKGRGLGILLVVKQALYIFSSAFLLNAVWENLHSFLYRSYMGGDITEFILLRASLFDAALIVVISLPFIYSEVMRRWSWTILILGTLVAIVNEWFGLSTGRWIYNEFMPVIPIIGTGLTPTLQLGVLGYFSYKLSVYALGSAPRSAVAP